MTTPTPIEAARATYAERAEAARRHAIHCHGTWRDFCHTWINTRVEAASVAYDAAVAEHYAGRHPLIASKEIAWG